VRISDVSIERPVLATVMSLVIVIFGALSFLRLPNRELPDVDPPVVSVTTLYLGAPAEVIETSITQPLEDQLIAIEGVKHLTSVSREQVSAITVQFELGRNVDLAANDVRDRVARARKDLPQEIDDPIVAKREADASPIMWIGLSSAKRGQVEISTLAETRIKDRLAKLPGVSEVLIAGEKRYSMRVWIDNDRLTAQRLTVADVQAALTRSNVEIPSGRIEGTGRELTVKTIGELTTAEQFGKIVVATVEGRPIQLNDVARVAVGAEDDRKVVRYQGEPAVGLGIIRQSKANTLDVAAAVKREIEVIRKELPADVHLESAYDSSIFIDRSIADVRTTIFEAVVLVILVIYLFLRSMRATIIPVIAIPISIIGTFTALDFMGFTINTLTLMGMTLAIGVVVDDAIVVLENVARWIEDGATPMEAARKGMAEISFAVIAATVSVIAVFLPLAFLTTSTGKLFREFGVTVAVSVAISGFVALTLSPMLCGRVLRRHQAERGIKAVLARGFERLADGYAATLRPTLRFGGATVLLGLLWFALGIGLYWTAPRELIPDSDRGSIFGFTRAPEGSTLAYTDRYMQQVDGMYRAVPEMAKVFSVVALGIGTPGAVNEGGVFAMLKPWEKRGRSQQEIVEELRQKLWTVPGMFAFAMNPSALGQDSFGGPVSLVIQGPEARELSRLAEQIVHRAGAIAGVVQPQNDLQVNKPQIEVAIDRDRAADLGVSVRDIATTLQILFGGLDLSTFKLFGETYKVMVELPAERRGEQRDLSRVYVHGRDGRLTPLASVVSVKESVAPRGLPHFDRLRAATISASLTPGTPLGGALESLRALAEDVLPDGQGYRVTFSGQSEEFFESGNALLFAYALAIVIVYLVLAAQFESFLHPIVVLVAVALSFTGALVALRLTGATVNLFSQIGLVLLVGLVTKNSILIVEFADQLRGRGMSLEQATYDASRLRFRPILMTALSTILGILPIALGLGAGGEARAPLGIAVVGGMLFSTLLTIYVVPATYIAFVRVLERRKAGEPSAAAGYRLPATGVAGARLGGDH
jgi:multidrug efflux pump